MASSFSFAIDSEYCPRWKYDVFLSFRGEDTRRTFTSHLYEEQGDSIPQELLKAIEESQVILIVFSRNYAKSRWCLNELVKIMECKEEKNGQTVIPIFYDVDPSHVRNQSESFAIAFAQHELIYKDDIDGMQKVQGWRTSLTVAANLKGYDIRDGSYLCTIESEKIQQIVDYISSKFCKSTFSVSFLQDVVGINAHLEKLKSQLQIEVNDVRILGIWGIGGVGKTTIAKVIFDTLSYQFKAACFLADIKENARKNQLHSLQNILLSELLRKKDDYVNNKYDGKCKISSRLSSMKVLIVLDDIDHCDHLEYLAGDLCWFGNGSRVIVTTRNRHLIEKDNAIYEVPTLPDNEAMQLFNQHAFKKEIPDVCFKKFSLEVVNHAKGLPLALKVWGSLLHKKGLTQWRRTVDQIKKNSNSEIVEKLKISFDGLEPEEKEIFLDIACFFPEYGLNVLIDKSLVFISKHNTIEMHDLIEDMGKYIVKMQKHPGERSRLWDVEDFKKVMVDNTGSMTVEAIWFNYYEKICFNKEAIKNMQRLRILCIRYVGDCSQSDSQDDSIEYLPNTLCWFVWYNYPWKLLPENFSPKRLVHLDLQQSSLHHLWNETKQLSFLRRLDLRGSKNLKRTPDFKGMPNLKVHHSLRYSRKLIELNLYGCESLVRFPYVNVESLESLELLLCSSLEKFPEILGMMKPELKIMMSCSGIRELPLSIFHLRANLTELEFHFMNNLVSLPSSVCKLKGLVKLTVSNCSKLESMPEEIGDLEKLVELNASYTLISRPPSSIIRLNKLKLLTFAKEESEDRVYFVFPQVNEGLLSLEELDLSYCNLIDGGLPEDIGCLSSLKELNLCGNNFEYLPRSIAQLSALRSLYLSNCTRLKELPEFPQQLDTIKADWSNDSICDSLFQNISSLQHEISDSHSLSPRVFTSWAKHIPSWFHHQGLDTSVSVSLPENWYVSDNFLGFAICYSGELIDITSHLIPLLCDDGMTRKLVLSNRSKCSAQCTIHFFLIPLVDLWDASNTNGKQPNDYGIISLFFGELKAFGVRLLYKDESELCIGIRKSRNEETSCSSSKKQRSQVEVPVSSTTMQLFPTSPGF
ncbi:hypothetical protein H5410_057792 [Solanum commersonii]|uniref:ADP-ribosyl cyclase/cyclic ADP-ribose hydrolase n=1 Tax=Solanum commersonii TaxID=4109 RepID=A0A9J5WPY2_SOLCO|nr:hypothetical protein H5410_057792 [Solanum commersonii]